MIDQKIKSLKDSILNKYNDRVEQLVSFCESPIEKLMLLKFLDYFNSFEDGLIESFSALEFIVDDVMPFDPDYSYLKKLHIEERIKKYSYVLNKQTGCYEKIIGFRTEGGYEAKRFEKVEDMFKGGDVIKQFEIYPQYDVSIDNKYYRIDIAILLNRIKVSNPFNKNNCERVIVETRKIAIECDGYEYHSSPEQKISDDVRTRKLLSKGWKVIRFSGSEIFSLKDQKDVNRVYKEVLDILYA
jgi:hypothetical protein